MEDGVKEEPGPIREPVFLGKAGWVKKAPGRLLASYKDRFVHVEKTEMVVYENEELQNCLERVDLENYEKCHELKSPFKKKHRLVLIRSHKSGNKVQDVKFQAQTAEEKEAWIKALSDGIARAKNKVFDEVKVDEGANLEHVTRTRPKGNRNRRPPTRIHMKEVAVVSSDGILRLDLDLEDAFMPNGNHQGSVGGPDSDVLTPPASEAAEKQPGPEAAEEAHTDPELSPQKKLSKTPMPPTKETKPSPAPEDQPEKDEVPEKKVLMPPMPPSKEAKPCISPLEEAAEDAVSEKSPDVKKKTAPPPTPPNKPSSSSSTGSLAEASQSRPNPQPPTPPLKHKKPSNPAVEPDLEVQSTPDENKEQVEDQKEASGTDVETDAADMSVCNKALLIVSEDEPESLLAEGVVSEEESGETESKAVSDELQTAQEPLRKCPSSVLTPRNNPEEASQPDIDDNTTRTQSDEQQDPTAMLNTDPSTSCAPAEEAPPQSEVPSVVVSVNDPVSPSPVSCQLPEEEKSVDSGQHSDDDSEGSGSEDTLATSTAALRGSHAGLDVLNAPEDDPQISVCLTQTQAASKPQVRPKVFPCRRSVPNPPLKPSAKARSASFGDLLSDSSVCTQVGLPTRAVAANNRAPTDDVTELQAEVALEMKKTSELLGRVSRSQAAGEGESEDLLAKAMEKLKKAEHVLKEVKKLKHAKNSSNRKSW